MKHRKQYLPGLAILAIAITGGAYAVFGNSTANAKEDASAGEAATRVAVSKAISAPYTSYLESIGKLQAKQQTLLSTEISGRVAAINFDSGGSVKTNSVLVKINDAPEQADVIRLRGEVAAAKAQFERLQELRKSGAESQRAYDDAKARYDAAVGDLKKVEAIIDQKTIRVPFDGELGIRQVHLGQYLQAGSPIATLTNLGNIRANFSVPERDVNRLRIGQSVLVTVDSFPQKEFEGKIRAIDPQLNESHLVDVQAEIKNAENLLRPGMYARVRIAANTENVLLVPESAIAYNAYGETVFQVYEDEQKKSRVRRANVKVGERRNGYVVILDGLKEGNEVVTSGQIKLIDGTLIRQGEDTIALSKSDGGSK